MAQPQMMGPPLQMGYGNGAGSIAPHSFNGDPASLPSNASFQPSHANFNHAESYNSPRVPHPHAYKQNANASRARGRRGSQYDPGTNSSRLPRDGAVAVPRVQAAPAVPSFFSSALPPRPDVVVGGISAPPASQPGNKKKKKKRDFNQLGLTPRAEEHESSEEELDEEAAFGKDAALDAQLLKFEYKGQTSTLSTTAAIVAWIEERKKRFPTRQRVQEKEAERARRMKDEVQRRKREALLMKQKTKPERAAVLPYDQSLTGGNEAAAAGAAAGTRATPVDEGKKSAKADRKRAKILKKLQKQQEKLANLDAKAASTTAAAAVSPPQHIPAQSTKRKRPENEDEGEGQGEAEANTDDEGNDSDSDTYPMMGFIQDADGQLRFGEVCRIPYPIASEPLETGEDDKQAPPPPSDEERPTVPVDDGGDACIAVAICPRHG
ncbi:MAG: hypothetical protein M1826_003541 [Phylliscum demangeonii]|nr:MAG: hypothetical protein M1826_003541 [Phylliscum demangeonii]